MEQGPPKEFLDYLLAMIAAGSSEGAKIAARLAEAGVGVPVSTSMEDTPKELLALMLSDTSKPLTARVIDITKKSDE